MPADWKLLLAFEAVARHGSFSRAAQELNVQQPAMSRRVAALETLLGTQLLHRARPALSMTSDGEILYRAVSGSLVQVQTALDQIESRAQKSTVIVNTTIGFASCFLMKRLHGFRDAHPDIMIELVSRDLNDSYQENKADVIITFDEPDHLPGVDQHLIFGEQMIAVCAPSYLKAPFQDRADLLDHRLLHLTQGLHGQDWVSYLGRPIGDIGAPASSDRFTSFIIYLQAVLNGDGIALGWEHLLDDHLASGSLVRAAAHVHRSDRGYFACLTKRAHANTAAREFVDWITFLATDQVQSG